MVQTGRLIPLRDELTPFATNAGMRNFDGAPATWVFEPPAGLEFEIVEIIVSIADGKNTVLKWDRFGERAALPNGLLFHFASSEDPATAQQLFDGRRIRCNFDLMVLGGWNSANLRGTFSTMLNTTIPRTNGGFAGFVVKASRGDSIRVDLSDDLSGVDRVEIWLKGIFRAEGT